MIDYGPLKVKSIVATASDFTGAPMFQVCVGLFTEKDHTLVATAISDEDGHVEIEHIKSGDYRLVAKSPGFGALNAKLRISRYASAKRLLLHMEAKGIDSTSYATLQ